MSISDPRSKALCDDELNALQARWGEVTYLAELYKAESELLRARLESSARESAARLVHSSNSEPAPALDKATSPAGSSSEPSTPSNPPFSIEVRRNFRQRGKYYGILSEVARDLDIGPTFVARVARGVTKSARVLAAIKSRMAKRDAVQIPVCADGRRCLEAKNRGAFSWGGKYYGIQSAVAKTLGISGAHVGRVASGEFVNAAIMQAILREMDRVDAAAPVGEHNQDKEDKQAERVS